jgi:DNA-binding NtrC family response regulator
MPTQASAARVSGLPKSALIGRSPVMLELCRELVTIAQSPAATILLRGATGTGKEVAARVLHGESSRASAPFVAVNCTAVPATLLEDMFFGHDAGAFTDAKRARAGLLEEAQGGTLFLDEIGDLDLALQAKLLRVLDERRVRRLGASGDRDVDVRIVAATNVDLERAVSARLFRADLYYRLDVVSLTLPPLAARGADVLLLAEHFLARSSARYGRSVEGFDDETRAALLAALWPGNVRQLAHAVERAVLLGQGRIVRAAELRLAQPGRDTERSSTDALGAPHDHSREAAPGASNLHDLRDSEMLSLARALERADGSLSEAARLLGVTRDTVRQRIRRYGLKIRAHVEFPPRAAGAPAT